MIQRFKAYDGWVDVVATNNNNILITAWFDGTCYQKTIKIWIFNIKQQRYDITPIDIIIQSGYIDKLIITNNNKIIVGGHVSNIYVYIHQENQMYTVLKH